MPSNNLQPLPKSIFDDEKFRRLNTRFIKTHISPGFSISEIVASNREMIAYINSRIAEAVKAERKRWIEATTGIDEDGDKVCNICLSWCQPHEDIVHANDCPAQEESE